MLQIEIYGTRKVFRKILKFPKVREFLTENCNSPNSKEYALGSVHNLIFEKKFKYQLNSRPTSSQMSAFKLYGIFLEMSEFNL